MKKTILAICLFAFAKTAFTQDYLTGKLTDDKKVVSTVYYDRTQLMLNNKVHQTLYKVLDEHKKGLYTISVTNDEKKSIVLISVNVEDSATMNRTIGYNRQKCGLIFSNNGDLDTVFPATQSYSYLFSFADTLRDYPVLHKINTLDQKEIDLDPLSKLRIRKHNSVVAKFYTSPQVNADAHAKENSLVYSLLNDTFNNQLFALRDSLYVHNSDYIDAITKMKTEVEYDYSVYMKVAHAYNDDDKYGGDEQNEQPHGKGVLLVSNGNIYDGTFATGLFITGKAIIKTKTYTYYGESYKDSMAGQGWLKYTNGSFLLGIFRNGNFCEGISLVKDADEIFFGSMKNNQRTGYGELKNNRGDISYYGEFLHGRFIKGYAKEVDQFGYSTYSRIQNGVKATVPAQLAEMFFDKVHVMKEKAEVQP